jgi:hypothetical protein
MSFELAELCKNQQDVVVLLRNKGITDLNDLAEITENDIRQLKLKDIVVRRRLIRYILENAKPIGNVESLEELCKHHSRTLNALLKSGIRNLDDIHELEQDDIADLEITNVPVLRRINKYIALQKSRLRLLSSSSSDSLSPSPDDIIIRQKHVRKLSSMK